MCTIKEVSESRENIPKDVKREQEDKDINLNMSEVISTSNSEHIYERQGTFISTLYSGLGISTEDDVILLESHNPKSNQFTVQTEGMDITEYFNI